MDLAKLNQDRAPKRRQSIDLTSMVYGKVPPQAKDLEEAILGALMLEKDCFHKISSILHDDAFYVNAHVEVFRAIKSLVQRNVNPDILVVVEELKKMDKLDVVGGPYFVTRLTDAVVSGANIEEHARIIIQKYIQRRVIELSGELINIAYEDSTDPFDLLEMANESFSFIQQSVFTGKTKEWGNLLVQEMYNMTLPPPHEGITGIPTGYNSFDKKTAGWQPADLIILAARPSMGKTAMAGQLAFRPAYRYKIPTLFFSLEMPAGKIIQRLISAESKILFRDIMRRGIEIDQMAIIQAAFQDKTNIPLWFNDASGQTLSSICSEVRQMVRKHGIKLVLIDYLQIISLLKENIRRNGNRDQDLGIITSTLKQLAKELDIAIIVLCQLSRATETTAQRRPQLSHLRESGNIEQDADIVMGLFREIYYLERENPGTLFPDDIKRSAEVSFLKHRNGDLGTINLIFKGEITSFQDEDDFLEIIYTKTHGDGETPF